MTRWLTDSADGNWGSIGGRLEGLIPYQVANRARKLACAWLALIVLLALAQLAPASADTLDWNTRPATNLRTGGTDAPVINGVTVTTSGSIAGTFEATGNTLAIQPTNTANGTTGYVNSTLDATVDDELTSQTTTINFSEPVYNVSMVVGDIDGGPTFLLSGAAFNDIVEFRANGGTVLPTSGTPVNATNVSWNAATGRASAIANISITNNQGNVTVTFAGPVTSVTVRHIAGANSNVTNPTGQFVFLETVTYTRSPRLTVTKISNGGVGPFNFSGTNGIANHGITTIVSGTGVAGAAQVLSLANTATTVTEAIPAGYVLTAATCTGMGVGGTATPNLATGDLVLNAAATAPGVNIACTFTNGKRPTVQARKISVGNVGTFNFTGTNGYAADAIATVTSNVAVAGNVRTLTAASTATTITEAIPAGYTVTAITCTGLGGGTATPNLGAGSVALNAAATAAANNVVCTWTNTKTPTMKVQKRTLGNFGGPFSFTRTNLASAPGNITTTAVNIPTPAAPAAINVTAIGTAITLTETPASGYTLTTASCSDANSAITGNPASFGTVAGNVLTVPAANVVAGADLTCLFTNSQTPTVMVQKTTVGGFGGPFTFGQTNLTAAPGNITTTAANTATPAAPVAINVTTTGTAVTLTETPAAGYSLTAASCTDSNAVNTGNPASFGTLAGNVLTIPAANVVAGANISCGFTNARLPTVQISKRSIGAVGAFSFTGTNGYSGDTITTVTSNVTVAGAIRTLTAASTATTITETIPGGYTVTAITCTGLGTGAATPNLAAGSVALNAAATAPGNTVACTFTNTRTPTMKVQKTTFGGFGGPFTFAQTNLASAPAGITTIVANTATPAAPASINITSIGTAVTLTETPAAGYVLTAASCTDANSAITGNPASFGSLAGNILTVPAANVVAGADITCGFTNSQLPTVQISKRSIGAVGAFSFTGTNGYSGDTITTVTSNVTVAGAVRTLIAVSTATTITETIPAGFTVTAITCTGLGSGTATPNLAAGSVALNAAATAAGNAVACTFTNTKTPTLRVQKITTSGTGGPFNFADTNVTGTLPAITTTAAGTAQPASPTSFDVTTIGTQVTITETVAAGFQFTTASCTDTNAAITGNSGSFGTVAGLTLTIANTNVVAGADFLCVFTNLRQLPSFSIAKAQTTGPSPVTLAGQVLGYTITVQNTGNQPLTAVTMTGDTVTTGAGTFPLTPVLSSGDTNSNSILDVGETWLYTASFTVTQPVMNAGGNITNAATLTTAQVGPQTGTSPPTPIAVNPGLTVVKQGLPAGPVSAGQVITYTFRVTNSGNVTITGVQVADTFGGFGTPPVPGNEALTDAAPLGDSPDGPPNNGIWSTLSPGDLVTFTAPYTVTQQDVDNLQ